MPPPRKIDLIPVEIRLWLQDRLKAQGFSGYVELTDELNQRLAAEGVDMTVGKSAVHSFGQEYEEMAKAQEEASAWAVSWMQDSGLEEEAKRHNVLFQMITTLAFKVMKAQMVKDGGEINPQELHFLGRLMKDVMQSSGVREKLTADERTRIAEQAKAELAAEKARSLDEAVGAGDLNVDAARAAKRAMGWDE